MIWQRIRSGAMFTISAITCPCHLPLSLPLALALLAGTPVAVWISTHTGWIIGGMTLVFLLGLALGYAWMNQPVDPTCDPKLAPQIKPPMVEKK